MKPIMEPRPPEEQKPDEDACPNCSWREWEKAVWLYTLVAAFILVVIILSNTVFAPTP